MRILFSDSMPSSVGSDCRLASDGRHPEMSSQMLTGFCHADWASVEPLTYLEPFLEVIRSPETSGPITGVALTSVRRLLEDYTFGKPSST